MNFIGEYEVRIGKLDLERLIDRWYHLRCFSSDRVELEWFVSGCHMPGIHMLHKRDRREIRHQLVEINHMDFLGDPEEEEEVDAETQEEFATAIRNALLHTAAPDEFQSELRSEFNSIIFDADSMIFDSDSSSDDSESSDDDDDSGMVDEIDDDEWEYDAQNHQPRLNSM